MSTAVGGSEIPILWNGRRAVAWSPSRLSVRQFGLSSPTIRATERAVAAATRASASLPHEWEAIARLILRTEGAASSMIEGVRSGIVDLAVADLDAAAPRSIVVDERANSDTILVHNNIATIDLALNESVVCRPLSTDQLLEWHRVLMANSGLPGHMVGAFRTEQGWIGGTSPLDAAFVPPPPNLVTELVQDMVEFVNRSSHGLDAIAVAAAAHAQFEIIHPFADGNGRIGRVLLLWVLQRKLRIQHPPPLSVVIERQRAGYLAGLTQFRLGSHDPWIRWMADVVETAANNTIIILERLAAIRVNWEGRIGDVRRDATAHSLLEAIFRHPVIDAKTAAAVAGVSERAARTALAQLAVLGIVEPHTTPRHRPGRPSSLWVSKDVVRALRSP
jgi:Fic family protein